VIGQLHVPAALFPE